MSECECVQGHSRRSHRCEGSQACRGGEKLGAGARGGRASKACILYACQASCRTPASQGACQAAVYGAVWVCVGGGGGGGAHTHVPSGYCPRTFVKSTATIKLLDSRPCLRSASTTSSTLWKLSAMVWKVLVGAPRRAAHATETQLKQLVQDAHAHARAPHAHARAHAYAHAGSHRRDNRTQPLEPLWMARQGRKCGPHVLLCCCLYCWP